MFKTLIPVVALLPLLFASPIQRDAGQKIQSATNGECLYVSPGRGGEVFAGLELSTTDCASANTWDINRGAGQITLSGRDLVLDTRANPSPDGGTLKVESVEAGKATQNWYWTDDNRIAITGGTQCLDRDANNGNVQVWTCGTGNENQVWNVIQ